MKERKTKGRNWKEKRNEERLKACKAQHQTNTISIFTGSFLSMDMVNESRKKCMCNYDVVRDNVSCIIHGAGSCSLLPYHHRDIYHYT